MILDAMPSSSMKPKCNVESRVLNAMQSNNKAQACTKGYQMIMRLCSKAKVIVTSIPTCIFL